MVFQQNDYGNVSKKELQLITAEGKHAKYVQNEREAL